MELTIKSESKEITYRFPLETTSKKINNKIKNLVRLNFNDSEKITLRMSF